MRRLSYMLIWIPLLLLPAVPALPAQPMPVTASYSEFSNSFTVTFDSEIDASPASFIVTGILIDDDNGGPIADFELRGGTVADEGTGTVVNFNPWFGGVIGQYTWTSADGATSEDRRVWGLDYADVVSIEEDLSHDPLQNLRIYLPAGAAVAPDGTLSAAAWVSLNYSEDSDPVLLTGATYNAATNILSLEFDHMMQFDQLPEDITQPVEGHPSWAGPGDGVLSLSTHEDRNENLTLDMEQNVNVAQITLKDVTGKSVTLSSALDMTRMDSATLELQLLPAERASVEDLATDQMVISFGSYTFVDVNYNPADPAADFPVDFIPDSNPLLPMSANYDLGNNVMKVKFSQKLGSEVGSYAVVPKLIFERIDGDTVDYALEAGTPGLSDNDSSLTVLLGVSTAHRVEDMIDGGSPAAVFNIEVKASAVLSADGNGNLQGIVPVEIIEESSNKGPELDPATPPYYDAMTNELFLQFDVRLDAEFVFTGVHFVTGTDTVSLSGGEAIRSGGNKIFTIVLNLDDQYAVENTIAHDGMMLLIDPYTVKQATKLNGNREAAVESFDYRPDESAPLIEYMFFDEVKNRLVIGSNATVAVDQINLTKMTLNGLTLGNPDSATVTEANRISLYLGSADVSTIKEEISLENRTALSLSIEAGFLTNGDGTTNEPADGLMDGDTTFAMLDDAVVDEAVLTLGYGREFWVRSFEAFPTVPRQVPASLRRVSPHALWYVANDQWVPYQPFGTREGKSVVHPVVTALRLSELDDAVDFFETETPKLNQGAHDAIVDLVAGDRASLVPERIDILFADIYDEFGLGRNDSKAGFWKHGYFTPLDLPGSEDANSNQSELIILDSYPQSFNTGDAAWNWDNSNEEWDAFNMTNLDQAGEPALANVFTQYVAYRVDKFEQQWVNLGLAYFSMFYTNGPVEFFGDGFATGLTGDNSLLFIGSDFKARTDYKHVYMYFLYLWEKYGGDDFITAVANSPRIGISGIADAFATRHDMLENWQQDYTPLDVYLDFATANLVDSSYNAEDHGRFRFENLNTQGAIRGTALKWKPTAGKDRPPYAESCPDWGFSYYFTGYGPFDPNLLLNPTEDDLVIFAGEDATNLDFRKVNMQATTVTGNMSSLPFEMQEVTLSEDLHSAQTPMSPNGNDPNGEWVFGPLNSEDYPNTTFPTWILIAAGGGDFLLHHESEAAEYSRLFVAQNPVVPTMVDLYVVSERPLYRSDGVAAPTVRVYSDTTKTDTVAVFDSPDEFMQTSVENASGHYEQYVSHVTETDAGELYWYLEGYYSNGVPVVESDPGMIVIASISGGQVFNYRFDDGFRISSSVRSFPADRQLMMIRSPEAVCLEPGGFDRVTGVHKSASASYALGGKVEKLNDPISLTLPFDAGAAADAEVGVYLLRNGRWDFVGGDADKATGRITVRVGQLGTYAVLAGPLGEVPADLAIPASFALDQNYPNPFNSSTTVRIALPMTSPLKLVVFDVLGREVVRLHDGDMPYGIHTFYFDGRSTSGMPLSSGVYFLRMEAGSFNSTRKMVLVK